MSIHYVCLSSGGLKRKKANTFAQHGRLGEREEIDGLDAKRMMQNENKNPAGRGNSTGDERARLQVPLYSGRGQNILPSILSDMPSKLGMRAQPIKRSEVQWVNRIPHQGPVLQGHRGAVQAPRCAIQGTTPAPCVGPPWSRSKKRPADPWSAVEQKTVRLRLAGGSMGRRMLGRVHFAIGIRHPADQQILEAREIASSCATHRRPAALPVQNACKVRAAGEQLPRIALGDDRSSGATPAPIRDTTPGRVCGRTC